MRASVEVDQALLRTARIASGARDDTEAVALALKALLRHRHLQRLLGRLGHTDIDLTREDLERWRRDD
jgi:hypothetical protein